MSLPPAPMLGTAVRVNFPKPKFHHFPVEFEFFRVSTLPSGLSPHPFTWHPATHCGLVTVIVPPTHQVPWPHSLCPLLRDHPYSFLSFDATLFALPCCPPPPPRPESGPHLPWPPWRRLLLGPCACLSVTLHSCVSLLPGLCALRLGSVSYLHMSTVSPVPLGAQVFVARTGEKKKGSN